MYLGVPITKVGPGYFDAIVISEAAFLTIEIISVSFYSITSILSWHGGWPQIVLIAFECTIMAPYSHVLSFLMCLDAIGNGISKA